MAQHLYKIESFVIGLAGGDRWVTTINGRSLQYCQGYFDAGQHEAPRLAQRIVRSDGKVVDERPAMEDVSIGMIAGWPTATQYENAAQRALDKAAAIRARNQEDEHRRASRFMKEEPEGTWWCNVHGRVATHSRIKTGERCCDPKLGGIMMPCNVILAPMVVEENEPKEEKQAFQF